MDEIDIYNIAVIKFIQPAIFMKYIPGAVDVQTS